MEVTVPECPFTAVAEEGHGEDGPSVPQSDEN